VDPFYLFSAEIIPKIKRANPGMSQAIAMKDARERWKQMTGE